MSAFHVDKLGCRLVSTYQGPGTEWLGNNDVDRTKLGAGNRGLSDAASGLYSHAVHRSPAITPNDKRVVVTMDFA